jgi:hypothetical protein
VAAVMNKEKKEWQKSLPLFSVNPKYFTNEQLQHIGKYIQDMFPATVPNYLTNNSISVILFLFLIKMILISLFLKVLDFVCYVLTPEILIKIVQREMNLNVYGAEKLLWPKIVQIN